MSGLTLDAVLHDPVLVRVHVAAYVDCCALCDNAATVETTLAGFRKLVCARCATTYSLTPWHGPEEATS